MSTASSSDLAVILPGTHVSLPPTRACFRGGRPGRLSQLGRAVLVEVVAQAQRKLCPIGVHSFAVADRPTVALQGVLEPREDGEEACEQLRLGEGRHGELVEG